MSIPNEAVQVAATAMANSIGHGMTEKCVDNAKAALTAALPFLQGVKVKALEWVDHQHGSRCVTDRVYDISIWMEGGKPLYVDSYTTMRRFRLMNEAKAAAQTDYEARFWSMAELSARDCACTKIQQDESCPVGYPSLLCEICGGKGVAPSPRAQALEEAARNACMYLETGFIECPKCGEEVETKHTDAEYALRRTLSQPVAEGLPQDVINLVIAAREAFDTGVIPDDEERNLDKALEAFASRVPYENEPGASV